MELNVINRIERGPMKSSKDYVQWELENQKKLCSEYRKALKGLPEGRMFMSNRGDKQYYYDAESHDYIGRVDNKEVAGKQQRYFLEKSISIMENNIKAADKYLKNFKDYMPEAVMDSLPGAYKFSTLEGLPKIVAFADGENWGNQHYDRSMKYPEHLIHKTMKGDMVRSKSELIVADILYQRRIPYHYEEPMLLGGKEIVPDFKIAVRSENRFKYLEHCGMLGDPGYCNSLVWKMQQYMRYGYVPWKDVIFTFDNMDGSIDTMTINRIIDFFFV